MPKAISEDLRLFDKPAGGKCDREELELFIVHHAALHSKLMLQLLRRLQPAARLLPPICSTKNEIVSAGEKRALAVIKHKHLMPRGQKLRTG